MTGFDDRAEHVLPVTIDVMKLLGHKVKTSLSKKTSLRKLIQQCAAVKFSNMRRAQAKKLDLDYLLETGIWERLPHASTN